jgi:Tol biopolymer transport system component
VWRCLAKNPEQRYGCMHDVRIQLEALTKADTQVAGVPAESLKQRPGSSRVPWLVAGIAMLLALIIGAADIFQAPKPASVVQSSILPPAGMSFVTMLPASGPAVLSPDGTRIAFSARDEKSKVLLYIRPLTSLSAQPLPGTEDAMYPFWSPDSREIGFFIPGKMKKINAGGGPPQTLCDSVGGRGGAWSQEGIIVFSPSTTQALLRVSAAGGTPEPASKLDLAQAENSHRWPSFLPDGKHFLYWSRNSRAGQPSVLYVGELGTLQAKALMKSETMAVYASGHILFLRGQTLMAQAFNPSRLELNGEPVPLAEHIAVSGATVRAMFSASNTGTLIYQSGDTSGGWNLVWWDRDGKQIGSTPRPERYLGPRLSPDGAKMVVEIFAGAQGIGDVWIFDLTRGTSTRLTFGPYSQGNPVWSPDGKTIYYASGAGTPYIVAKAADGSAPERIVLENKDAAEIPASFSPDGRYLVYIRKVTQNETGYHPWALPLFGDGKPFPIVQSAFEERYPEVSPDGKWMAYQSNESGRWEVYITSFPGGGAKWQVSSVGGASPKWRGDRKEIFYLDPSDNIVGVDVNASGGAVQLGTPHTLFQAIGIQREYGPFDVSADGKRFLLNSGNLKEGSDPFTLVQNWPAELKK